jgi:hypothetical protein
MPDANNCLLPAVWAINCDLHDAKEEVVICYYVDRSILMLARMAEERLNGNAWPGYTIKQLEAKEQYAGQP